MSKPTESRQVELNWKIAIILAMHFSEMEHVIPAEHANDEIMALFQEELIVELESLIGRQDIAWVKRGDTDSHEMFVHTNVIRDRIAALKVQGGKNG